MCRAVDWLGGLEFAEMNLGFDLIDIVLVVATPISVIIFLLATIRWDIHLFNWYHWIKWRVRQFMSSMKNGDIPFCILERIMKHRMMFAVIGIALLIVSVVRWKSHHIPTSTTVDLLQGIEIQPGKVTVVRSCDLYLSDVANGMCFDLSDGKGHHVQPTKEQWDALGKWVESHQTANCSTTGDNSACITGNANAVHYQPLKCP